MIKIHVENRGCDDTTEFDMYVSDFELNVIEKFVQKNNENADSPYCCTPKLRYEVIDID